MPITISAPPGWPRPAVAAFGEFHALDARARNVFLATSPACLTIEIIAIRQAVVFALSRGSSTR